MTVASARLFLGLCPDPPVRHALAAWRDGFAWPRGATPVRSERLHLTLHFIGDVERDRVSAVADALASQGESFALRFDSAAVWPHGIAVMEPDAVPAPLMRLHAALAAALSSLGLPLDGRPYRPHVTLARRAAGAAPAHSGPAVDWDIGHYCLMESTLGAGGGYTLIRSYPLSRSGSTSS
jgi:2'-5' RNA ligase